MGNNKYDIFISYRRDGGAQYARILQLELEKRGYRVFLDYDELTDGIFGDNIKEAIREAPIFMMVLSAHYLDRCKNEGDWVREEIMLAISQQKHFVPINPDNSFDGTPADIPQDIKQVVNSHQHSDVNFGQLLGASINRLVKNRVSTHVKRKLSMTYDVFISYSRKDTDIADKICKAFDKNGITYFIDRQGIGGGLEFPAILAKGIRESKVFLFLASKNSYDSKFTQSEIVYAFNKKQKQDIIPYIIDGSSFPDELEFTFSAINWRRMDIHPIETIVKDILAKIGQKAENTDIIGSSEEKNLIKQKNIKTKWLKIQSYISQRKFSCLILAISTVILIGSIISDNYNLFLVLYFIAFPIFIVFAIIGLFKPSIIQLKSRQEVINFYFTSILFLVISLFVSISKEDDTFMENDMYDIQVEEVSDSNSETSD